MIELAIFIFSFIFILNSLFILVQIKKYKVILPTSFSVLFILFHYSIFPLFFLLDGVDVSRFYIYSIGNQEYHIYYLIASLLILVFTLCFYFGYFLAKKQTYKIDAGIEHISSFKRDFFVLFLITTLCYLGYIYIYGGFGYVIENISHIRSGKDINKNYIGAFLRMFSDYYVFLLYALYAYFNQLKQSLTSNIDKNKLRSVAIWLFVFVAFVLFKKFLDGGRGGIITVFLGLFFIYTVQFSKLKLLHIFIGTAVVICIILYGKTILFQLFSENNIKDFSLGNDILGLVSKFIENFAHGYMSIINSLIKNLGADRLFADFIFWLFKPLKLLGIDSFDSISYYNTYHLIGIWESDIPLGIVGFFYQEGGVLFVPIGAIILGYFFSHLDLLVLNSMRSKSPFIIAFLIVIILQQPRIIGGADIALYIQSIFVYVVLFMIFLLSHRIRIKKRVRK